MKSDILKYMNIIDPGLIENVSKADIDWWHQNHNGPESLNISISLYIGSDVSNISISIICIG